MKNDKYAIQNLKLRNQHKTFKKQLFSKIKLLLDIFFEVLHYFCAIFTRFQQSIDRLFQLMTLVEGFEVFIESFQFSEWRYHDEFDKLVEKISIY